MEVFFCSNSDIIKVNPEELIKYLIIISCDICDSNTKKQTIKNLKLLLNCLIRLLTNNAGSLHLIDILLNSTFTIFSRLNLSDAIDYSV
jgi:hypothetical protein